MKPPKTTTGFPYAVLLFFFILLMATFRAIITREHKTVHVRPIGRFSCIDRSVPNIIEPQPTKTARLFKDEKTNKTVWILENID